MSGHTPGPWEVHESCVRTVAPGRCVARLDWAIRDEVDDANARLIAAAPDLLEALGKLRRVLLPVEMQLAEAQMADDAVPDNCVLFSFMGSGASDHVTVGEFRAASDFCDAAISKARGVQ